MSLPKDPNKREEYIRKQIESHKGKNPWNKGIKTGHTPWNKGITGYMGANKTSFKKGLVPWSKGRTDLPPAYNKGTHIQTNTGKTHFKKGQVSVNKGKKRPNISGENSCHWKGGLVSENKKIRQSLEIKLWRKSCFERDNFTDQKTGVRGSRLVVHHINNFADFPELRTSISNGITLSVESHREFHKIYGKRNNTREQLLEFIIN